jgi:dTDP-4-dehydrorhamnose 3,5-epimerase
MRILSVSSLALPEVKVITFGRFCDARGYFTETFRMSDIVKHPETGFVRGIEFVQGNESFSRAGTIRGLHFQWNPYMGKLVRTLSGRMVDLVLDIRKQSPTFAHVLAYPMPARPGADCGEWIWVPPGFAHGNFFTEDSHIEYLCSGEYSAGCEAGISPLSADINWSLCAPELKAEFEAFVASNPIITDKDKNGLTASAWKADPRSENFIYGPL